MIGNMPNNDRIDAKNVNTRTRDTPKFDRCEMPNDDGVNAEL